MLLYILFKNEIELMVQWSMYAEKCMRVTQYWENNVWNVTTKYYKHVREDLLLYKKDLKYFPAN